MTPKIDKSGHQSDPVLDLNGTSKIDKLDLGTCRKRSKFGQKKGADPP